MEKAKLTRVGKNCNGHIAYKEESTGKFYLDINDGEGEPYMVSCHPSNDPDGEPGWPIKVLYEIVNPITEREKKEMQHQFKYMMLGRLQFDCNGFLSEGDCRYHRPESLWGKTIEDHIAKMKELWQKIPEDIKPEWLTWEQILDYEKRMLSA